MEGLAPLLPLQYGLHESIPKLTETLRLSMNANDKALEAALNSIDYNEWMKIGKEVADPVIRSMCDHVAKELAMGSPACIVAGLVIGAAILYGAYCAGKKFGTLTSTQKAGMGLASAGVGGLAGAGITKLVFGAAVAGPGIAGRRSSWHSGCRGARSLLDMSMDQLIAVPLFYSRDVSAVTNVNNMAASEVKHPTDRDLSRLNVPELKKFLRRNGHYVTGNKSELLKRAIGVGKLRIGAQGHRDFPERDAIKCEKRRDGKLTTPLGERIPDPVKLTKWTVQM
ncbi:uncharacterized protein [Argopecten irradians]|uniref:uncharacterized protein n=1 Tax=Argopecten irradians TaxID=31199 RepID=UPI003719A0CC